MDDLHQRPMREITAADDSVRLSSTIPPAWQASWPSLSRLQLFPAKQVRRPRAKGEHRCRLYLPQCRWHRGPGRLHVLRQPQFQPQPALAADVASRRAGANFRRHPPLEMAVRCRPVHRLFPTGHQHLRPGRKAAAAVRSGDRASRRRRPGHRHAARLRARRRARFARRACRPNVSFRRVSACKPFTIVRSIG